MLIVDEGLVDNFCLWCGLSAELRIASVALNVSEQTPRWLICLLVARLLCDEVLMQRRDRARGHLSSVIRFDPHLRRD